MLEFYDLNARHQAAIIWGTVLLAFLCFKSGGARSSLFAVFQSLLKPAIAFLMLGLLANVVVVAALSVAVGRQFGLWQTIPAVAATVWFLSAGISLLLNFGEHVRNDDERLKTHIKALIPSTIISEVAAFAILPFWWEISLAPVLLLITILWIVGQNDKQKRFGGTLLLIYGVGLLAVAGIGLLSRPEGWCTLEPILIIQQL